VPARKFSCCIGAADIIGMANRRGRPVVLVTNQDGIARGFYGWADFEAAYRDYLRAEDATGLLPVRTTQR
jgi:histidinol phosphatase-like enzyme